uniref:NADH:ubiquinone reductase (H(+)-translocating) n=1 Tax=Azygia hwangtsiyui TaxID=2752791 RepID=A0A7D5PB79_9TREM|nr:NADH dehydrogenase subunit 5 [Azygia hwangtsiyui]QLH90218.1 NADH dehydrogenase subunit 5 [Azygia hwangtsiyui]
MVLWFCVVLCGVVVFLFYVAGFCGLEVLASLCGYGGGGGMNFSLMVDSSSLLCLMMLFICSIIVLPFLFHYMGGYNLGAGLYFLVNLFIFVMVVLMLSSSFLTSLLGWEYLGLVSYLLILFLGSLACARASLITLVSSRFGDVALFFILCFSASYSSFDSGVLLGLCFLLVVLTKSACFPFTSWLLEAMRAPTPVSCLVHSSTLVAAGVWFCLRYDNAMFDELKAAMLLVSVVTIYVTALSALHFVDLKKLVALSTCNNISWCLMCYCLDDAVLCIMFLVTHGVSKCLLFMSVGDLMSSSGGSQSSGGVYLCRYTGVYGSLIHVILLSSLCGLPFMGVFITKHVVMERSGVTGSVFVYLLVCGGVVLSFGYTYRFVFLLLNRVGGLCVGVLCSFYLYGFMGVVPLVVNYVGSYSFCWVEGCLTLFWGVVSIYFYIHLAGVLMGLYFYLSCGGESGFWGFVLGGCECFVGLCYEMYVYLCSLVYFVFYRWEVGVMGYLLRLFFCYGGGIYGLLMAGFMVLGVLWLVGFCYFFVV